MDVDRSNVIYVTDQGGDNLYAGQGMTDDGLTVRHVVCADSPEEAGAILQGYAIAEETHLNQGPWYGGPASQFRNKFRN